MKALLDELVSVYNVLDFIHEDPISVPHRFTKREDIEISGFFTATMAWGKRAQIIKSSLNLMSLMDNSPFDFVQHAGNIDLTRLKHFSHRTLNGEDVVALVRSLRHCYNTGGLQKAFFWQEGDSAFDSIQAFRNHIAFLLPKRTLKHISNPESGSACKRLNMFLRWMVRKDNQSVDFGLWQHISTNALMIPLDVHTSRVARKFKLLERKQNDRKAVEELTARLRLLDPIDPVRYDFALFGLGVSERRVE